MTGVRTGLDFELPSPSSDSIFLKNCRPTEPLLPGELEAPEEEKGRLNAIYICLVQLPPLYGPFSQERASNGKDNLKKNSFVFWQKSGESPSFQ